MSQTYVHDSSHHGSRQPHSKDAHKTIRALSAFDAGREDDGGAASPSISMGSRENHACIVEKIAFDPAFRNKESSKVRETRDKSYAMPAYQKSSPRASPMLHEDSHSVLHRVDRNQSVEDIPGEYRVRPRSASTVSWSAFSSGSQSRSPSRLVSSTSSIHGSNALPGLQVKSDGDQDGLEPLVEEEFDPASFDLVVPASGLTKSYSLEIQSELLFSAKHLATIFDDPSLLQRFTNYLHAWRPESVPLLTYYLDARKALKAIQYANALSAHLKVIDGLDFTSSRAQTIADQAVREKADKAFETILNEDLPAFITQTYIQTVSLTIKRRISNTLPSQLREQSEGLAEVFCLTDPSRPDNPIVFASEEFHKTTQYGMSYVLGRNCRFLQGPKTNPFSVKRIREKLAAGKEHCETFLNYRRDGSPFMNLLMVAPLLDSRGIVRYHIGAQVDVSGLVKSCAGLESLSSLTEKENSSDLYGADTGEKQPVPENTDSMNEFQELAEMFNLAELKTVRESGGILHRTQQEDIASTERVSNWHRPRLLISDDATIDRRLSDPILHDLDTSNSGRLSGIYEHYLLVRPFPNLRVLFASPSLRVPGMLQSSFVDRIGGSDTVRDTIVQAFAEGNGITAKVRWNTRMDHQGRGRPRWIHCTPLLGLNGAVGVWMVVLVDDESEVHNRPQRRDAPPISRHNVTRKRQDDDQMSLGSFADAHRVNDDC